MKFLTTVLFTLSALGAWAGSEAETKQLLQQLNPPEGAQVLLYDGQVQTKPFYLTMKSDAQGVQSYQFCSKDLSGSYRCEAFGDNRCQVTAEKMQTALEDRIDKYENPSAGKWARNGALIGASLVLSYNVYRCLKHRECRLNRGDVLDTLKTAAVGGTFGAFMYLESGIDEQKAYLKYFAKDTERSLEHEIASGGIFAVEVEDIGYMANFLYSLTYQVCEKEESEYVKTLTSEERLELYGSRENEVSR